MRSSHPPTAMFGVRVPPPLPITPPLTKVTRRLEAWTLRGRALLRLRGGRYAKIGAGLFGAGVLVGIGCAAIVFGGPERAPVETAPIVIPASATPKAATSAPVPDPASEPPAKRPQPLATGPEPLAKRREAAEAKAASGLTQLAETPASTGTKLPISSSPAPTCRQLLGKSISERRDPKRAAAQTVLANRALVLGNVKEAHAAYCLAWAWDRANVDRRLNLATLYLVRRDWAKAAELGQSALELDPENRRGLSLVSDAWAALHKTEQAREAFLAVERKPQATEREVALMVKRDLALAKAVERKGDFALAERLYRRVLLLAPEHTGAMRGVAGCLVRLGDARAAKAWARNAQRVAEGGDAQRSG